MLSKLAVCLICFALSMNCLARQAAKERKAVELLGYASQVAAAAGDEIWPGFDARQYSFVMTDEYTIGFGGQSKEPVRNAMMSFDMRGYGLEDAVALIFHEAFHVFERDDGARWREMACRKFHAYFRIPRDFGEKQRPVQHRIADSTFRHACGRPGGCKKKGAGVHRGSEDAPGRA